MAVGTMAIFPAFSTRLIALTVVFYTASFFALAAMSCLLLFFLSDRRLCFLFRFWQLSPICTIQALAAGVAPQIAEKTFTITFYTVGFLAFTGDIFVVIFGSGWSNFFWCFSFGNILVLLYNILGFEINVFHIFPPNSPPLLFSLISATIVLFEIFIC